MILTHLVELLLPLDRRHGGTVPREQIQEVVDTLAERFGGATAFTREPAEGLWKKRILVRDRIVLVEVMVESFDESWWRSYRTELEAAFDQEVILIRVTQAHIV